MGQEVYTAIGLMSGTSLDGVDVAAIKTDGQNIVEPIASMTIPYPEKIRQKIKACFGLTDKESSKVKEAERLLTFFHVDAVDSFFASKEIDHDAVDLIGFHGQTITHDPKNKFTWQIGDGKLLAHEIEIPVVNDFRSQDVKAGGQGAPLLPVYHRARLLAEKASMPALVLNIGGVANVTYIGQKDGDIVAFDTGPGNALIDDYIYTKTGQSYDENGKLALSGYVNQQILDGWMALPFFALPIPKSLDRNDWDVNEVQYLNVEDATATLSQFTVESVRVAESLLPEQVKTCYVAGGGRHNAYLMKKLHKALKAEVKLVDDVGLNGDSLEAEGFAYLAVRSIKNLPLSYPKTTGVPTPMSGGTFYSVI